MGYVILSLFGYALADGSLFKSNPFMSTGNLDISPVHSPVGLPLRAVDVLSCILSENVPQKRECVAWISSYLNARVETAPWDG